MALTPSTMAPLGSNASPFKLPDTDGKWVSLDDFPNARGFLILFICNHCPYVKHLRTKLAQVTSNYIGRGLAVIAINSNDVENYPADSPEKMKLEKSSAGYQFPYLFDEAQDVAKAYGAACTPDLFLYDASRKLVYRGQFDDSRPGNDIPVTGKDLTAAVDALLDGKSIPPDQRPSVGCNIKWRKD